MNTKRPILIGTVIALVGLIGLAWIALNGGVPCLAQMPLIPTPTADLTRRPSPTSSPSPTPFSPTAYVYLPHLPVEPTPTRTPTPTSTPTPTPTSTTPPPPSAPPTSTPTSTPTTAPPGVYVLSNHSHDVTPYGDLQIAGEVWNHTTAHLRSVKVTANLFDGNGQLVGVASTYIHLSSLPAETKTCFKLSLPEPAGWSYYEFEAPTYTTDGWPLPDLVVLNDSGSYDPSSGWYRIIGLVRNDQDSRVEYVRPIGTLYASGIVLGCESTYVNSTHLDPGQSSSFDLPFIDRNYAGATSYRLQVDGQSQ